MNKKDVDRYRTSKMVRVYYHPPRDKTITNKVTGRILRTYKSLLVFDVGDTGKELMIHYVDMKEIEFV